MTRKSTTTTKCKSMLVTAALTVGCFLASLATTTAGELKMPLADFNKPAAGPFDFELVPKGTDADYRTAATEPSLADRLTFRYSDPTFVRFVEATSVNGTYSLYDEVNRLIDERHVIPKSYDERVKKAVTNLMTAMDLPVFWKANGSMPSSANVASMKSMLSHILDEEAARNSYEARQVLNWVVSNATDRVGLKPQLTIMEFVYGAIESMDKFSGITLPSLASGEPRVGLEENVVGIGVEIETVDEGVRVVKVLKGGPAMDAGLAKNDVIHKVNGTSIAGMTVSEVAGLIVGKAGTKLNVELDRAGSNLLRTMTRRSVTIPNVSEVSMIDPIAKVGYVKLERFTASSHKDLEDAMWKLYNQNMKSMILDLRGNPGGLLTSAISISDLFLPCGTIVSTKGRRAEDNSRTAATFNRTWNMPLVVLVDEGSASASEIVAAAIQENGRGLVVGTKSYGKGTVQSHFEMRSVNATVRLTTANFYAPSGRVMADAGVTPDELVEDAADGNDDVALDRAVEAAKGKKVVDLANSANNCKTTTTYNPNGV